MATDDELTYAEHVGRFYVREHGFPPVTGRLLGFLLVCDPPKQTIGDLADALLASRSAITGAVKMLAEKRIVRRTRDAGERGDHVSIDPAGLEPPGFDGALYREMAELSREGLTLLPNIAAEQRLVLSESAELYEFLAERMPAVLEEWRARRGR